MRQDIGVLGALLTLVPGVANDAAQRTLQLATTSGLRASRALLWSLQLN